MQNDKLDTLNAVITQRMIESLKEWREDLQWTPPWVRADFSAFNPVSGATYSGGNRFMLSMIALMEDWSNEWATYRQWQTLSRHSAQCVELHDDKPIQSACRDLGCSLVNVEKGSKSSLAFRPFYGKDKETGEDKLFGFRAYNVFNASQVTGYSLPVVTVTRTDSDLEQMTEADEYARSAGAKLVHSPYHGASYHPTKDYVTMPDHDRWTEPDRYWSTLTHELVHWTGNSARLNRTMSTDFGSDEYAFEELVAELGASFQMSNLGRASTFRDDHLAYLQHWLRILTADSTLLWKAANHAERAVKHINAQIEERNDIQQEIHV
jgi:antirestriction protein ArdC